MFNVYHILKLIFILFFTCICLGKGHWVESHFFRHALLHIHTGAAYSSTTTDFLRWPLSSGWGQNGFLKSTTTEFIRSGVCLQLSRFHFSLAPFWDSNWQPLGFSKLWATAKPFYNGLYRIRISFLSYCHSNKYNEIKSAVLIQYKG